METKALRHQRTALSRVRCLIYPLHRHICQHDCSIRYPSRCCVEPKTWLSSPGRPRSRRVYSCCTQLHSTAFGKFSQVRSFETAQYYPGLYSFLISRVWQLNGCPMTIDAHFFRKTLLSNNLPLLRSPCYSQHIPRS